jgi:hypothetical protein
MTIYVKIKNSWCRKRMGEYGFAGTHSYNSLITNVMESYHMRKVITVKMF